MTYRIQLFKLLTAIGDHIYRIKRAEKLSNFWKTSILLIFASAIVYGWMAYLGIGSNLLSIDATLLGAGEYGGSKIGFLAGRVLYGILFAAAVLFIPSALFYLLTEIPYQKLVIMQQVVLVVLLLERLIWIPLIVLAGLDWYVTPLSLGIIFSYLIENEWFIYFFGAITLFQGWIIWFVYRFLHALSEVRARTILLVIILLHIIGWAFAATIAVTDIYIISGWFE
ncbi:hypothetical protein [Oceanobacillus sp. FSL H7-0719]|uniref:hypothetical protein n=1 Tax=Oceanobacillus sp. FSL H7-0719 TaxID=2954507 RepID=UPI00324D52CE